MRLQGAICGRVITTDLNSRNYCKIIMLFYDCKMVMLFRVFINLFMFNTIYLKFIFVKHVRNQVMRVLWYFILSKGLIVLIFKSNKCLN